MDAASEPRMTQPVVAKKHGRPAGSKNKPLTGIAAARQAEKKLAAKTGRRPRT